MGDSDYPKYTPLKYGFAYQLPESEDFLFAKATVEKIVDLRRRALEHMERMLQEEVFMSCLDDHNLSDWPYDFGLPHSNLTVIDAPAARDLTYQHIQDRLIEDLGQAIVDSAELGQFKATLSYPEKAQARSVASLARSRGYDTYTWRSIAGGCWYVTVSWK